jgi:hypothetical protein
MAKLIQICASENDLFGLDDEGAAYHYNFNTDSWMKLGRGRGNDLASPSPDRRMPATLGPPEHEVAATPSPRGGASDRRH